METVRTAPKNPEISPQLKAAFQHRRVPHIHAVYAQAGEFRHTTGRQPQASLPLQYLARDLQSLRLLALRSVEDKMGGAYVSEVAKDELD